MTPPDSELNTLGCSLRRHRDMDRSSHTSFRSCVLRVGWLQDEGGEQSERGVGSPLTSKGFTQEDLTQYSLPPLFRFYCSSKFWYFSWRFTLWVGCKLLTRHTTVVTQGFSSSRPLFLSGTGLTGVTLRPSAERRSDHPGTVFLCPPPHPSEGTGAHPTNSVRLIVLLATVVCLHRLTYSFFRYTDVSVYPLHRPNSRFHFDTGCLLILGFFVPYFFSWTIDFQSWGFPYQPGLLRGVTRDFGAPFSRNPCFCEWVRLLLWDI